MSLERYGIYLNPDFTVDIPRLDKQLAFQQVAEDLSVDFGFSIHKGMVKFTSPDGYSQTLRDLLNQRGLPLEEIDKFIKRQGKAVETYGCASYTGDIELDGDKTDYIIFISNASSIIEFPITLGEEVTHGEHVTNVIEEQGITFDEHQRRFHIITEEFLGYVGRKKIMQRAELTRNYPPVIDAGKATYNDWSHMLAYLAVDELVGNRKEIPARELFHAPDEAIFWQTLREALVEPFTFNMGVPADAVYDPLQQSLNELLEEARAQDFIKLNFVPMESQ